jgi:hypothetical protein
MNRVEDCPIRSRYARDLTRRGQQLNDAANLIDSRMIDSGMHSSDIVGLQGVGEEIQTILGQIEHGC